MGDAVGDAVGGTGGAVDGEDRARTRTVATPAKMGGMKLSSPRSRIRSGSLKSNDTFASAMQTMIFMSAERSEAERVERRERMEAEERRRDQERRERQRTEDRRREDERRERAERSQQLMDLFQIAATGMGFYFGARANNRNAHDGAHNDAGDRARDRAGDHAADDDNNSNSSIDNNNGNHSRQGNPKDDRNY